MEERDSRIADAKLSTEEKIKRAAAQVFTKKGFNDTTTRDITSVAGIPLGSLHYYYRTKEKLFQVIAEEAMVEFARIMHEVFREDLPLDEKIRQFVCQYIDFCKKNPFIPNFCINEFEKGPGKLHEKVDFRAIDQRLKIQIDEYIAKGLIRPITLEDFIANLVSMTIFPFLSKKMLMYSTDINEAQFNEMLERRKTLIPEMIIGYLFLEK